MSSEKGREIGPKKKFNSPLMGKHKQKKWIFPRLETNLKELNGHGMKGKNRAKSSRLKFQMGGDCSDPLNLKSLIDRDPSERTPSCSPCMDREKELSPQVIIAKDITDPLNLKGDLGQDDFAVVLKHQKKKKNKRKRADSSCFDDERENQKEEGNAVIKEEKGNVSPKCKKRLQNGKEGKSKGKKKKLKMEESKVTSSFDTDETENNTNAKGDATVKNCQEIVKNDTFLENEDSDHFKPEEKTEKLSSSNDIQKPNTIVKSHQKQVNTEQQTDTRKPKSKKVFLYGNYNHYYGYRNPQIPNDTRVKLFHLEWFKEKVVLDIGCNTGQITMDVARNLSPKHILGIDIDSSLIKTANRLLRGTIQEECRKKSASVYFPMSFMMCRGPIVARTSPTDGSTGFPYNIQFKEENFVPAHDQVLAKQKPTYDVILCLSITKWIHLNWGDEGLKRTFKRIYLLLNPEGRLVLEAQPYKSYARRKNLSEKIRRNYDSIRFKPDQFVNYLMSKEVGFATYESLGVPENNSKGFQRPVYVFTKSKGKVFTEN